MGKTAACIKLIQILSCRGIVSTNELAELIETNPRNIKEYIREIELAGYTVESIKGIYGGYRLDKRSVLPSLKLNDSERRVINESIEFLNNSKDFLIFDDYQSVMGKITSSFVSRNEMTPVTMIDRFPLAMDKNLLNQRYMTLAECIDSQLKCEITYLPASNVVKQHIIHPYKLFVYNGSWFVLAWNEKISDFGYYKLNRIESIVKTKNHFSILKTYDERNYLDQFGMKQNGEYYPLELELYNLNTVIQERIYGKNQNVEVIDNKTVRFTCEMQNKGMILSFVMSFGTKCKVISPQWLVEAVKNENKKLLEMYEEI